jgi:hypothetical protein
MRHEVLRSPSGFSKDLSQVRHYLMAESVREITRGVERGPSGVFATHKGEQAGIRASIVGRIEGRDYRTVKTESFSLQFASRISMPEARRVKHQAFNDLSHRRKRRNLEDFIRALRDICASSTVGLLVGL